MSEVKSAIIMAAGASSRFAPLSIERPKALLSVRGEVLIERQIRQLRSAGVPTIVVVTGYQAEQLAYLSDKFGVTLVHNPDYPVRNNHSSLYVARDYLADAYICSADNYFPTNPFERVVDRPYYATVHSSEETNEYVVDTDATGRIVGVTVGGRPGWYMLGHAYLDEIFAQRFSELLVEYYERNDTLDLYWEDVYRDHLDELVLHQRMYPRDRIQEFDSLSELRAFDPSYWDNPQSKILHAIAEALTCREREIRTIRPVSGGDTRAAGFTFTVAGHPYEYRYDSASITDPLRQTALHLTAV